MMSNPTEKSDAPVGSPELVSKLVEVFNARMQLDSAIDSMRDWFNHREPGQDFGLRLLDCALWAQNLGWLLTQAQILVKGEE